MADILRIKRRVTGAPGAPASLANAEIAYNEVDHTLYYGEGTGGAGGTATVVVPIGGSGAGSSANPLMDGVVAPGTSALWSRGDHVHPVDTSRYAATNPAGYQTAPQVLAVRLDQFALPATAVNFNNQNITGLATPVNALDGANKGYVDSVAQGLDAKPPVLVATTASISLSGTQVIDTIGTNIGDRVLVKDQTTPSQNGIYVVGSGLWTRALDADAWTELISAFTFVERGANNGDAGFLCTVDPGGTLGSSPVTWVQFSSAGQISAGAGLTKTGTVIDVVGATGRIVVYSDNIDIDPSYIGQTTINTLGTVQFGTWTATTVAVSYGGTGATSLTGHIRGNGTSPFTASATIPNTDITGLGTMSTQNSTGVSISGGTIDGITFDMGTF